MSPVIIAIHGRDNKLPVHQLKYQWKKALNQGLAQYHTQILSDAIPFEMAYYADCFYESPLKKERLHFESLNPAPVLDRAHEKSKFVKTHPALRSKQVLGQPSRSFQSKKARISVHLDQLESRFQLFSRLANPILKRFLPDVYAYFHHQDFQTAIEQPLRRLFTQYQNRPIILLSHSLGTVIAYKVLMELDFVGKAPNIQTWITMGSPLGFTHIKGVLARQTKQQAVSKLATPECVEQWVNISDKKDKVSFDHDLNDDFKENSRGIAPEDRYIKNQYPYNNHKSYGYLWSQEVGEIIKSSMTLSL